MSTVVASMSLSLDGIAAASDEATFWPVHEAVLGWVFDLASWRERQGLEGGVDSRDSRVLAAETDRVGAYVLGRRMFDYGVEPWGDDPPFRAPCFVVTHRPHARLERAGGTSYTFVPDIATAVAAASEAAGERVVQVEGGVSTVRAALAAGLVDELSLHVVPTIVGQGMPLLADLPGGPVGLDLLDAQAGEGALHLRYAVRPAEAQAT